MSGAAAGLWRERLWPYRRLRRQGGASVPTALLFSLLQLAGWTLLRLEGPAWQPLLKRRADCYPHLAGRAPRVEDLPQLRFTEMIVKEVLRLYPPIWAMVRTAVQDCQIGGYRIQVGALGS